MKAIIVNFIFLSFFLFRGFSQQQEYTCDHFNISNGLISDNVFKIFMDKEGFTWILTYNGLQKYDGYRFESYTSKPGIPGMLSSNFVVDIFEDRTGHLIVVLEDGIDVYDKKTDSFSNILSDLPFAEAKRNEISRQASVVQDKSGFIWANCNNHLVRIDSSMENFLVYQNEFNGNFVLNKDSTILWIITDHTLKQYLIEDNVLSITNVSDIPGPKTVNRLNVIYYDSENICWVGTSDGLFIFDEKNYCFVDPGFKLPGRSHLNQNQNNNITAIFEDFRKDLWIASGMGLYKINKKTGTIQELHHEADNPNTILNGQISGIFGNESGNIWITYLNEGFTRMNIRTRNFHSYSFKSGSSDGLGGKTVRSVFKDRLGYIWVGLYNSGLNRINPHTGKINHFRHDNENKNSIYSDYISSIYVDENNRLWIGSHDNGLCYADNIYNDKLNFKRPSFLNTNDEVYHILADSLSRVWFGTRTGLGMYDYQADTFQWILTGHNVQSFLFDKNTIWIASWNYGLCKLNFTTANFSSRKPEFDPSSSLFYGSRDLKENRVLNTGTEGFHRCISIYRDQNSVIWLGTYDKGLIKVDQAGNQYVYTIFDKSRGTPGNAVYGVIGDIEGFIWISTDQGIGKFDPRQEKFENYYRTDGLLSDYFMWKAYYLSLDGEMFFGSVNGLNYFYPQEIINDAENLQVIISELRVDNNIISCNDVVNGDILLTKQIIYQDTLILNHRNNNFSLDFFASKTMNPERIRYQHMLVGFDKSWITNEEGSRNASYSNLDPGVYYFLVRATENDGIWQNNQVEKVIILLPPWWKTKWALSAYFVLITGLLILIVQSYIKFLNLKHDLIYNEKLHQSKLMFFTNISHEFKTPLSLIKAPINEILIDKTLSRQNRKNLLVAQQNADNLLNLVNELMEFRRTDAGISRLKSELIDLVFFVREITSQFEYIAEEKEIPFFINIPDEKIKIWVDKKKFRKIINNLLGNAFKYTPKGGVVTFSIIKNPEKFIFNSKYHTLQLSKNLNNLEYIGILVSDSGVGISRESLPKIFDRFYQIEAEQANEHIGSGIGLALVKNLVLLHRGNIQVASERRTGTEILVSLPLGDSHLTPEEKLPLQTSESETEVIEPLVSNSVKLHSEVNVIRNHGLPEILLIEDNVELRNYLKDNFTGDYIIYEASNGKEGIEKLKKHSPDLIITDWIMPNMDGGTFIKEIKSLKFKSSIPILLLTAKDDINDKQEALDLGADFVVTKPFNLQLLKSQVRRIIENNRIRMQNYGIENSEILTKVHNTIDSQFITAIEGIIFENINNPDLDAELIARELALSRTTLFTKIRELADLTPGQYIQKTRLKHAVKLMQFENLSVSEVYSMVGISSSSYFVRLFRKYFNSTPMEYLKNSRNRSER